MGNTNNLAVNMTGAVTVNDLYPRKKKLKEIHNNAKSKWKITRNNVLSVSYVLIIELVILSFVLTTY